MELVKQEQHLRSVPNAIYFHPYEMMWWVGNNVHRCELCNIMLLKPYA